MSAAQAELEIIRDELKAIGITVPMPAIIRWSVEVRARVEHWAIRKRWSQLSNPPCPDDHEWRKVPRPRQVNQWMDRAKYN